MAELIVSSVLEQLSAIQQADASWRLVVVSENEVHNLEGNFGAIRAVLADAEWRPVKQKDVEDCLTKVTDTTYDIDDALDEWNTAIQKLLMKESENASSNPVRKVFSFILSHMFCHRFVVLRFEIASKFRNLSKTLDTFASKKNEFNVSSSWSSGVIDQRLFSESFVNIDPLELHGRDKEKNDILKLLLSESSQGPTLKIISITGLSGMGKTTLARNVFNDGDVKTHFDKRVWVSASYPMDEIRVSRAILESLKGGVSKLVEKETVLQYISECIQGKKFLLVLDDVCTGCDACTGYDGCTGCDVCARYKEYWEQLKYSLKCGSEGSRILITTCGERITSVMGPTEPIRLDRLSEKDSWSLFCQFELPGGPLQECEELEEISRKVVDRCMGLPLAVKILGNLLHFKRTIKEWKDILDSEIWELEKVERRLFLPLMLSYSDLPFAVRKCFSYCAVFPKNSNIEKHRLIKLWMAQGYLWVEGREDMELIGEEYFETLAMRCFFQDFQKNEFDGRIISCKMHDTVHDFALFLAKNECFIAEVNEKCNLKLSEENIRHLMLTFEKDRPFPISVYNKKKLRSLVVEPGEGGFMNGIVLSELFDQLTCLRTLDLSSHDNVWCKVIKEVPRGIKKLIHLRYLNLSKNKKIKELPETLCELYNLQTLELSWCSNLNKLPRRMGKLINLRHLVNVGNSLSYMPRGIETLICLRTLSEFIVSGGSNDDKACKLECLENLNNLQGSLRIKNLENVKEVKEINAAELMRKKNLTDLYMSFKNDEEKGRVNKDDENVIEDLLLPPNLERLEIFYYRGSRISLVRITPLTNLRWLSLDRCLNLEQLPHLGELSSLESLTIRNMRSLEKVGNEFLGTYQSSTGKAFVAFPKLKTLEFQKMEVWKEWKCKMTENDEIMPRLHSLTIGFCPKLETLLDDYLLQKLEELKIISCPILKERYKEETAERQKISHIKVSFY